jgi:hypothetical protein
LPSAAGTRGLCVNGDIPISTIGNGRRIASASFGHSAAISL